MKKLFFISLLLLLAVSVFSEELTYDVFLSVSINQQENEDYLEYMIGKELMQEWDFLVTINEDDKRDSYSKISIVGMSLGEYDEELVLAASFALTWDGSSMTNIIYSCYNTTTGLNWIRTEVVGDYFEWVKYACEDIERDDSDSQRLDSSL